MSERWVPLDIADCDPNPFVQFRYWFDEATSEMPDREAVALVSVGGDGQPSARMVLLRLVDATSFGWYTNYHSRKARELDANPRAALLWYCANLGRQIRIEGLVEQMTPDESDAYFATRARGHQIGAHASDQSQPIVSRRVLEERVEATEELFEGRDVARPEQWGGFRLRPSAFEFWQHRTDRLHDRVRYELDVNHWHRERLAP